MTGGGPTRRIVVTGSECTGKTTLVRYLAERLGAPWVEEYSRRYADGKGAPLDASDVEPIARGQIEAADAAVPGPSGILVLDTDLVSTVVYARHYYGSCPRWIEEAALARRGDLYLLCHPDVPWVADGVRDRGERRAEMHALFAAALRALGAPVADVTGERGGREERALLAVRRAW